MPKLEFLGWDHRDGGYSDDVMIRTKETPGSFSFPSLKNLTGTFSVYGPIKRYSFPETTALTLR